MAAIDSNSDAVDGEVSQEETVAGTSRRAGDAETEIVPPPTQAAPELAWSAEDETTEIRHRSWRTAWSRATIFVVIGVVIACAVGITGWTLLHRHAASSQAAAGVRVSRAPQPALPPSAVLPPQPVLDGTYEIFRDVARTTYQGNAPAPRRAGILLSWWAFRSTCTPAGCTAKGVKVDDTNHSIPSAIRLEDTLRYDDGQWSEVPMLLPGETEGWCNAVASRWQLRPQPDGVLVGTETLTITADCPAKGNTTITPITATRTGPVPSGVL